MDDRRQNGAIWWVELTTPDLDAAKAHYGAVAGWTFEEVEGLGERYVLAKAGGRPVAGMFAGASIPYPVPPHWLTYIAVEDIEGAVAAARSTGGKVLRDPFDVPGVGVIAIVSEPTGAAVGLIRPADWGAVAPEG